MSGSRPAAAAALLAVLTSYACAAQPSPTTLTQTSCPTGSTARLTFVNNCADKVWVVETPPGGIPGEPTTANRAQWDWFKSTYATKSTPYSDGSAAMGLDAGATQLICVPDAGAPSGNFRFFMDCPKDDPYAAAGCTIGAATGDLAGVNTLFEASYGCKPGTAPADCAFNYSSPAPPPTTTMSQGIDSSTDPVSFTVASAAGLPTAAPFEIGVGSEVLEVTKIQGTTLTATRGGSGTTQAAHAAGEGVYAQPDCRFAPSSTTCQPIASPDYFDVSAVDGYTIPLQVEVGKGASGCNRPVTDASMLDLASCPTEDTDTLYSTDSGQEAQIKAGVSLLNTTAAGELQACSAPYKWFQTAALGSPHVSTTSSPGCSPINSSCYYAGHGCDNTQPATFCPGGSGPQQRVGPKQNGSYGIQNTEWVTTLHAMGYLGYTWQYDDGLGTQQCDWGEEATITLCPAGGTPYLSDQLWVFSSTSNSCAAGGTGTPDGATTFGSLFACQTAKMRYACQNLTDEDPYQIPTQVCSASAAATGAGTGMDWNSLLQGRKLVCANLIRGVIPGGGYNPAVTAVVSGLDNVTDPVTFDVADASIFPQTASFYVRIDNEILQVTAITGQSLTANRGQQGSSPQQHGNGARVLPTLSLPICSYEYPKAAFL